MISGGAGRAFVWVRRGGRWEWEEWIARDDATPFPDLRRVVKGETRGADLCGEAWAQWRGIPVRRFPVVQNEWKRVGRKAGPLRNAEMARHADAVVLFPGGPGTKSMAEEADLAGLRVIDWRWGIEFGR